jgi:predicted RNA-binding protein
MNEENWNVVNAKNIWGIGDNPEEAGRSFLKKLMDLLKP